MAAKEIKHDHITRHSVYAIDDSGDLAMLPTSTRNGNGDLVQSATCCIGSKAIAVDGKTYMLSGDDVWVEYKGDGGSGGGGEPSEYDYITDDDIAALFNQG